jgi:hypothetical protein
MILNFQAKPQHTQQAVAMEQGFLALELLVMVVVVEVLFMEQAVVG